jgi:hypothetical protein
MLVLDIPQPIYGNVFVAVVTESQVPFSASGALYYGMPSGFVLYYTRVTTTAYLENLPEPSTTSNPDYWQTWMLFRMPVEVVTRLIQDTYFKGIGVL